MKLRISSMIMDAKGFLAQAWTHLVSCISMQLMRFSIQTAIKLVLTLFVPQLYLVLYAA
jgi:hypothetical protein